MIEIHQSDIQHLTYLEEEKILFSTWNKGAQNFSFQNEMLIYLESIKVYLPDLILIDITQGDFVIPPKLREWTHQTIDNIYTKVNVKKIGIVLPEDLLIQKGIENTVEHSEQTIMITRYFSNVKAAMKWLVKPTFEH